MLSLFKKVFSVTLAVLMYAYMGIAGYEPSADTSQDKDISVKTVTIRSDDRELSAYIIAPKEQEPDATGVLWIHGGGYLTGMKEMAFMSRALDLVKKHGAVVIAPDYTLSVEAPYPAAFNDCYNSLLYLKEHAQELGINDSQLMVGGESAGGGLCAAVCMKARDTGDVNIAFQMPLYPMLDNFDTESSKDNHGKVWNTKMNHLAWKLYLRQDYDKEVSPYAAPARQTDYSSLPPAYTFVGDGEPFYCETLQYIENLKKAGVTAQVDVYNYDIHAVDMMTPWKAVSKEAIKNFNEYFSYAQKTYFAPQS